MLGLVEKRLAVYCFVSVIPKSIYITVLLVRPPITVEEMAAMTLLGIMAIAVNTILRPVFCVKIRNSMPPCGILWLCARKSVPYRERRVQYPLPVPPLFNRTHIFRVGKSPPTTRVGGSVRGAVTGSSGRVGSAVSEIVGSPGWVGSVRTK